MATSKKSSKKSAGKTASAKKAAKKSVTKGATKVAKKAVKTAAKKPYPENDGKNTKPPRMRPPDAVDLLVDDHLAAAECFDQYESMMEKDAPAAQRQALANKVCAMLKVHTQIEEEIFYPAARDAGLEEDMMDEADVEHAGAKVLIAQIEAGKPGVDQYDAKVKVLGDIVTHHVVEEQTEMFPSCRRSDMDLVGLRAQLADRKSELEGAQGGVIKGVLSKFQKSVGG